MDWKREWKWVAALAGGLAAACYLPVGEGRFDGAVLESLALAKWYAREHVVLCLMPALAIAGAISVFISQASVMKYLGAGANRVVAYGVAAVSGTILAVCSCTVLPLFAGIWKRGAGLGPATAFLYSGPAINVLAIILTARVLGLELGVARAAGAVLFSVVVGLLMHLVFRKEERARATEAAAAPVAGASRPLWQTAAWFGAMVAVLVFANWAERKAGDADSLYYAIGSVKWALTAVAAVALGVMLVAWFGLAWWKAALAGAAAGATAMALPGVPTAAFAVGAVGLAAAAGTHGGELGKWFEATWDFAKLILPLLAAGVLASGFLLGGPEGQGIVPREWISGSVGDNSVGANLAASVAGALMYFATLTEVPILQGLLNGGMAKGPALALLLAGPSLSLPNMLVLRGLIGTSKTLVYVGLVVVMATLSGVIYGAIFG